MTDKIRVTVMVLFAAGGHRFLLYVVVKIKEPYFFRLITYGNPPLPYPSKKMHGLIET